MDKCAESEDGEAFLKLDREFNLLMLAAARNGFAASAMSLVQGLSRRFWFAFYRQAGDLPRAARLHGEIARAISKGNRDEAAAASDRLMTHIEEFAHHAVTVM